MKKAEVLLMILIAVLISSFRLGGYETAMQNAISSMYSSSNVEDFQSIANTFNRIGAAEKDKWLPYYYSAYSYIMMAAVEKDMSQVDGYLDNAEKQIATSENLNGDKVELLVLKGFANMMRIGVDPATRGQEFSIKSVGFLQQAMQIDNTNPRAILMLGQMQYGTAQFFGSGTEEACATFTSAKSLFEKEESEDKGLLPIWGKPQVEGMLKKCSATTDN